MNVAILDHVGCKAGMDYYSSSLGAGMVDSGCKVDVYSNFTAESKGNLVYYPFFAAHQDKLFFFKFLYFLKGLFLSLLRIKMNNTNFVIVHLFSTDIVAFLLSFFPRLLGVKVIVICHDANSFCDNDSKFLGIIIYKFCANKIVVHNTVSQDVLKKSLGPLVSQKIIKIKHGGFISIAKNSNYDSNHLLDIFIPKTKYLLFFGQIKKVKGLDLLLRSLSGLPDDVHLVIAGKVWKDDFTYYQSIINDLGLQSRVTLIIRFITDEERHFLFKGAYAIVLPYKEIFQSGVLLMAMSYGIVTIASDLPGNKEVLTDGVNGFLFECNSIKSLNSKIRYIYCFPEKSSMIGKAGFNTIVNDYSWESIGRNYFKLFLSL